MLYIADIMLPTAVEDVLYRNKIAMLFFSMTKRIIYGIMHPTGAGRSATLNQFKSAINLA